MKDKIKKIVVFVIIFVIVLVLINVVRNFCIIKGINKANEEFKNNFSKLTNYHMNLVKTSVEGEKEWKVQEEIHYKDGRLLYNTISNNEISNEETTQVMWYNYNENEGVLLVDNEKNNDIKADDIDMSKHIERMLIGEQMSSLEIAKKVIFSKYIISPIMIKDDCYVFKDGNDVTCVSTDSKLINKMDTNNTKSTYLFEEGTVQEKDVEKTVE